MCITVEKCPSMTFISDSYLRDCLLTALLSGIFKVRRHAFDKNKNRALLLHTIFTD